MCDWKDGGIFGSLFSLFEDSPQRVSRPKTRKQYRPDELHTFMVEKPFCCPPNELIEAALHPVGIPVFELKSWIENMALDTFAKRMKIEMKTFENLKYGGLAPGYLPMAFRATFKVPKTRANQAEYLMLSTQRLIVIDGMVNHKNEAWAARRGGKMPRASDPQRGRAYAMRQQDANYKYMPPSPAYESACIQAKELWAQVEKLAKAHQEAKQARKHKRTKNTGFWSW